MNVIYVYFVKKNGSKQVTSAGAEAHGGGSRIFGTTPALFRPRPLFSFLQILQIFSCFFVTLNFSTYV